MGRTFPRRAGPHQGLLVERAGIGTGSLNVRMDGYVMDKVEGLAIDAAGTAWVVTDNKRVDDSSGGTLFWSAD